MKRKIYGETEMDSSHSLVRPSNELAGEPKVDFRVCVGLSG